LLSSTEPASALDWYEAVTIPWISLIGSTFTHRLINSALAGRGKNAGGGKRGVNRAAWSAAPGVAH